MQSYIPGYIRARQTGRLKQAIQKALDLLSSCTLCPRRCRVETDPITPDYNDR